MAQFGTALINEVVGFDVDSGPPNVCLVLKDENGNEYGIQLTPSGLQKTIVLAMQALVAKGSPDSFAEASLTGCKHFLAEDGRPSLVLQFDGVLEIAFPLTKPEGELIVGHCTAALALMERTGTKEPAIQ